MGIYRQFHIYDARTHIHQGKYLIFETMRTRLRLVDWFHVGLDVVEKMYDSFIDGKPANGLKVCRGQNRILIIL